MAHLLLVDDDQLFRVYITRLFRGSVHTIHSVGTGAEALQALDRESFDLVLCDYKLPDIESVEILKRVDGRIPVIMITGHASIQSAVDLIRRGAFNYLVKPVMSDLLLRELEYALDSFTPSDPAGKTAGRSGKLAGSSLAVKGLLEKKGFVTGTTEHAGQVRRQIERVAPTTYSVVIQGESGTSKEITALSIHLQSLRKEKPFIAVDCGVLTPELARSELFGHEKGAFTGASDSKKGQFLLADGGTLFLDEIGNLPFEVQGYFLRALQEGVIYPVGSQKPIPIDVRVLVASNVDLQNAVQKGAFRSDLFHRLNEYSIRLKPLREQKQDILPFAEQILKRVLKELKMDGIRFAEDTERLFVLYDWPGNIREMQNAIRRACLLTDDEWIRPEHLPQELADLDEPELELPSPAEEGSLESVIASSERREIEQALKRAKFNKSEAARNLGIDRKTLYNKIEKYGIEG